MPTEPTDPIEEHMRRLLQQMKESEDRAIEAQRKREDELKRKFDEERDKAEENYRRQWDTPTVEFPLVENADYDALAELIYDTDERLKLATNEAFVFVGMMALVTADARITGRHITINGGINIHAETQVQKKDGEKDIERRLKLLVLARFLHGNIAMPKKEDE